MKKIKVFIEKHVKGIISILLFLIMLISLKCFIILKMLSCYNYLLADFHFWSKICMYGAFFDMFLVILIIWLLIFKKKLI
jgi:hypothetical protein